MEHNIIFLDIDGVMRTSRSYTELGSGKFDPKAVQALDALIIALNGVFPKHDRSKHTYTRIVISSSIRFSFDIIHLKELFANNHSTDAARYIMDKTGPRLLGDNRRGMEIYEWLKANRGRVRDFVIVDDRKNMGPLLPHLVQTDREDGFTLEHADKIFNRFNRQPSWLERKIKDISLQWNDGPTSEVTVLKDRKRDSHVHVTLDYENALVDFSDETNPPFLPETADSVHLSGEIENEKE